MGGVGTRVRDAHERQAIKEKQAEIHQGIIRARLAKSKKITLVLAG
jgi:hypothetical protein